MRAKVEEEEMKVMPRICSRFTRIMVLVCLLAALAAEGRAQSPLVPISPLSRNNSGWSLYNASASFGYSAIALPTSNARAFSLERVAGDYDGTASISFGYNYTGPKGSVSLLYAPSYVNRVRYSQLNSFNQSLNFKGSLRLTRRWDFSLAVAGTDTMLDQLLFAPAILSASTSPLATLDDLIPTAHAGQYTSDQLASILTGTPYVVTPARSIIYGTRYLSASLNSSASYRYSPRLRITFIAEATRSQTHDDEQKDIQRGELYYPIPRTTTGRVGVLVNYSLSLRTEIGIESTSTQIDSSFNRYIIANPNVFLSRKLRQNWFVRVSGGPGFVSALRTDPRLVKQAGQAPRQGYTAQGNLGYTVRDQRLLGSYSRMVADTFGFGSQSSEIFGAAWQWSRPGHSWTFYASGGLERMVGGALGDVQNWYGNAGFARSLSRQLSYNFTYGYVVRRTGTGNMTGVFPQNLHGSNVRMTLIWNPQGHGEALVANTGSGAPVR
jgi:hypothetical protein